MQCHTTRGILQAVFSSWSMYFSSYLFPFFFFLQVNNLSLATLQAPPRRSAPVKRNHAPNSVLTVHTTAANY